MASSCRRFLMGTDKLATVDKISHLFRKVVTDTLKPKDELFTEKLRMLHNIFAVVPVDKISGNVTLCLTKALNSRFE